MLHRLGQGERAQEVAQVVGERVGPSGGGSMVEMIRARVVKETVIDGIPTRRERFAGAFLRLIRFNKAKA